MTIAQYLDKINTRFKTGISTERTGLAEVGKEFRPHG